MKYQTMTALFALTFAVTMPVLADGDHDHDHGDDIHGGDIELEVDSHGGEDHIHVHGGPVFAAPLGVESGGSLIFTGVTNNPGFDSEADTFAPDSEVGFDLLAPLKSWDGAGFITDPTYKLQLSQSGLTRTTDDGFVSGFSLGVGADGKFHRHWQFSLLDAADAVPTLPTGKGVYLLEVSMWSDDASIEASEPFWIVFNFGETESTHDAAAQYVQTNLVPEPASVALLGVAALALMGRRRAGT